MYNQISGVPDWRTRETRFQVKEARKDFLLSIEQLKLKKEEYRQIKIDNATERKELIKEAKVNAASKFDAKKAKKADFLPAIRPMNGPYF